MRASTAFFSASDSGSHAPLARKMRVHFSSSWFGAPSAHSGTPHSAYFFQRLPWA
jgi:hypothetical protein